MQFLVKKNCFSIVIISLHVHVLHAWVLKTFLDFINLPFLERYVFNNNNNNNNQIYLQIDIHFLHVDVIKVNTVV